MYALTIPCFRYDKDRVKEVGPDRAAAEWLLKNGAFVRWQGHHEVLSDYNLIGVSGGRYIEGIDCTGSSVSNAGFRYLSKFLRFLFLFLQVSYTKPVFQMASNTCVN